MLDVGYAVLSLQCITKFSAPSVSSVPSAKTLPPTLKGWIETPHPISTLQVYFD